MGPYDWSGLHCGVMVRTTLEGFETKNLGRHGTQFSLHFPPLCQERSRKDGNKRFLQTLPFLAFLFRPEGLGEEWSGGVGFLGLAREDALVCAQRGGSRLESGLCSISRLRGEAGEGTSA